MELWKKLNEESVYDGFRKIHRKTFETPDGQEVPFDCIESDGAVCVLALTDERTVILTKQFRPGPEKVLCELPGGGLEPGELPEDAAERELLEETGYVGNLQFVGTSLHCAYSTLVRHNFVATGCKRIADPKPDEHERIEVREMSLPEFIIHLRSGQLTDVATGYLGLDFLGLLKSF